MGVGGVLKMLEVCELLLYRYVTPGRVVNGKKEYRKDDFKARLLIRKSVLAALGIEPTKDKEKIPILVELRDGYVILKVSRELQHDDVILGVQR
jgi:hypothetical protein